MKLTSMQVSRTLRQFEARAIPENHPIISQLSGLFGEHTFLLDRNGLNATSRRALAIWSVAKAQLTTSTIHSAGADHWYERDYLHASG
jgi:hypothetical protein